jgi:hypothetical protein
MNWQVLSSKGCLPDHPGKRISISGQWASDLPHRHTTHNGRGRGRRKGCHRSYLGALTFMSTILHSTEMRLLRQHLQANRRHQRDHLREAVNLYHPWGKSHPRPQDRSREAVNPGRRWPLHRRPHWDLCLFEVRRQYHHSTHQSYRLDAVCENRYVYELEFQICQRNESIIPQGGWVKSM